MLLKPSFAAACLLALAACGGGDDGNDPADTTATTDAGDSFEVGEKIGSAATPRRPAAVPDNASGDTPVVDVDVEGLTRTGQDWNAPVYVNGFREIAWEDLLPEGEQERIDQIYQEQMMMLYASGPVAEGSAADTMQQWGTFNAVQELDGEKIRIPGFTVPFEYGADAKITQFLLVPYFGACIHAPPPPPNQTLLIRTDEPISLRELPQAVWIEGEINIEIAETDLADAAYVISAENVVEYDG